MIQHASDFVLDGGRLSAQEDWAENSDGDLYFYEDDSMVGMGVSEPVEMVDVDAGLRLHSMDLASQSVVSGSIFWDGDSTTMDIFMVLFLEMKRLH